MDLGSVSEKLISYSIEGLLWMKKSCISLVLNWERD